MTSTAVSVRFGSKAVFAKRPQSARSNGIDSSSPTGTVVPKLEFVRNHFEEHDLVETTAPTHSSIVPALWQARASQRLLTCDPTWRWLPG